MKHYGKLVPLSVPYERFSEFLEDLKDRDVLCVHVVDAMNFDSSVIPGLERLIGRKPLVLVVNKADLLPTDIRQHRIVKWVRRQAKRLGMQNIVAVHLVSAKKGLGMREAVRTIADLRKKRDVYVIGAANVGKSTFLNRFLSTWWNLPPPPAKGSSQGGIMLDELPEELQATFANVEEGEAFPSNIADLRHRIREIQLEKRKKEKEAQGLHTEEWVEKQFQARMKNKSLNWKATTSHDDDDDEAILLDGPE
ncbi:yqeH, partial [Symbiodinium sp. KB8]